MARRRSKPENIRPDLLRYVVRRRAPGEPEYDSDPLSEADAERRRDQLQQEEKNTEASYTIQPYEPEPPKKRAARTWRASWPDGRRETTQAIVAGASHRAEVNGRQELSGTWAVIRYARVRNLTVVLLEP